MQAKIYCNLNKLNNIMYYDGHAYIYLKKEFFIKKLYIYIYIFIGILATNLSFASQKQTNLDTLQSPQGWLKKNATLEQRKLIVNLQVNNAAADIKMITYRFVPYDSPENKMINTFPPHIKNFLINKFSSLLFEGIIRPLKDKEPDASIRVSGLQLHTATDQDIQNFISDYYNFLKW